MSFYKSLLDKLNSPFTLLDDRRSRIFLILFCGLFGSFFVFYFNPFNLNSLTYENALGSFLSIWVSGFWGAVFLSITQLVLRKAFKLEKFLLKQFIIWVFFEFMVLGMAMYILFGESHVPFFEEFILILKYTASIAFLPYFLACLILSVYQLSTKVREISVVKNQLNKHVVFKEENEKIALSIQSDNLLYLQSENNYTSIFYLENDKLSKKLIRTNLKKLETELTDTSLFRIHRSHMVNLNKISNIQKKKGAYHIQLTHVANSEFKVSDSYVLEFESHINQ